jgi:hypothetical protein
MSMLRKLPILMLAFLPGIALGQVRIARLDPVVQRHTFDPKNPPTDMPKLAANESAKTRTYFGADANVRGSVVSCERALEGYRVTVKVESLSMTLRLDTSIWVPQDAVPKIVNHEEGHWQIARHFYAPAEAIARQVAEQMLGHTVSATGKTYESAVKNALQETVRTACALYLGWTDGPAGKAQEYYDQITAHGTKAVREDRAVSEAIDRAKGESWRPRPTTMTTVEAR